MLSYQADWIYFKLKIYNPEAKSLWARTPVAEASPQENPGRKSGPEVQRQPFGLRKTLTGQNMTRGNIPLRQRHVAAHMHRAIGQLGATCATDP